MQQDGIKALAVSWGAASPLRESDGGFSLGPTERGKVSSPHGQREQGDKRARGPRRSRSSTREKRPRDRNQQSISALGRHRGGLAESIASSPLNDGARLGTRRGRSVLRSPVRVRARTAAWGGAGNRRDRPWAQKVRSGSRRKRSKSKSRAGRPGDGAPGNTGPARLGSREGVPPAQNEPSRVSPSALRKGLDARIEPIEIRAPARAASAPGTQRPLRAVSVGAHGRGGAYGVLGPRGPAAASGRVLAADTPSKASASVETP